MTILVSALPYHPDPQAFGTRRIDFTVEQQTNLGGWVEVFDARQGPFREKPIEG